MTSFNTSSRFGLVIFLLFLSVAQTLRLTWAPSGPYDNYTVTTEESIEFVFSEAFHNVIETDLTGYETCDLTKAGFYKVMAIADSEGAVITQAANPTTRQIGVTKYFVCTWAGSRNAAYPVPVRGGHCENGQKVIIDVVAPSTTNSPTITDAPTSSPTTPTAPTTTSAPPTMTTEAPTTITTTASPSITTQSPTTARPSTPSPTFSQTSGGATQTSSLICLTLIFSLFFIMI